MFYVLSELHHKGEKGDRSVAHRLVCKNKADQILVGRHRVLSAYYKRYVVYGNLPYSSLWDFPHYSVWDGRRELPIVLKEITDWRDGQVSVLPFAYANQQMLEEIDKAFNHPELSSFVLGGDLVFCVPCQIDDPLGSAYVILDTSNDNVDSCFNMSVSGQKIGATLLDSKAAEGMRWRMLYVKPGEFVRVDVPSLCLEGMGETVSIALESMREYNAFHGLWKYNDFYENWGKWLYDTVCVLEEHENRHKIMEILSLLLPTPHRDVMYSASRREPPKDIRGTIEGVVKKRKSL